MRLHRSILIARPPDEVFAFVADRGNDRLWRSELMSSRTTGGAEGGVGAHIHELISYQGRVQDVELEVTDIEPGRRVCIRAHGGVRAHGCYEVRPEGDDARLSVSATVELKGNAAMLERYIQQAVEEAADADLERLKAIIEGA